MRSRIRERRRRRRRRSFNVHRVLVLNDTPTRQSSVTTRRHPSANTTREGSDSRSDPPSASGRAVLELYGTVTPSALASVTVTCS